jgi:enamine deaminase RidA (YjgF/YER057c/UK114 family)
MTDRITFFNPESMGRGSGFSHGAAVRGRTLYVAGQTGRRLRDGTKRYDADFIAQFVQALDNVLEVVKEAGGTPQDIVKMTIYVTRIDEYRSRTKELAAPWKARFGKHFPAMALVAVSALVDEEARVEIETIASLPD